MNLTKCNKGHFFDNDRFAFCPHCNRVHELIALGKTPLSLALIHSTVNNEEIIRIDLYDSTEIKFGSIKEDDFYLINNPYVSKLHAEFSFVDGKWFITDTDSLNGTYLNGEALYSNKKYPLYDGDTIDFAHSEKYVFRDIDTLIDKADFEDSQALDIICYEMNNTKIAEMLLPTVIAEKYSTPTKYSVKSIPVKITVNDEKIFVSYFYDKTTTRVTRTQEFDLEYNKPLCAILSNENASSLCSLYFIVSDGDIKFTDCQSDYILADVDNVPEIYFRKNELNALCEAMSRVGKELIEDLQKITDDLENNVSEINLETLFENDFLVSTDKEPADIMIIPEDIPHS